MITDGSRDGAWNGDMARGAGGVPTDDRVFADLSPEDAAALEGYVERGWRPGEHPGDRERVVHELLSTLADGPRAASSEGLIELTLARVAREHAIAAAGVTSAELSPSDEDAVDSLVQHAYDASRVPGRLRARAVNAAGLLALIQPTADAAPGGQDALVLRTLERVQRAISDDEARLRLTGVESAPVRGRFHVTDLISAAAVLLISGAIIWPMAGALRQQSRELACRANMLGAGAGFATYASDFRDSYPMASASQPGNPWWNVGSPEQSNSANLFQLVRAGYSTLDQLACKGNTHARFGAAGEQEQDWRDVEQVSYSFQNMFASPGDRPTWTRTGEARSLSAGPSSAVVIVDRSPVVLKAIRGEWISPLDNSPNHCGRGQNALFSDGSAAWHRTPVLVNGDNLWLPREIEDAIAQITAQLTGQAPPRREPVLRGVETPSGRDDGFVGP